MGLGLRGLGFRVHSPAFLGLGLRGLGFRVHSPAFLGLGLRGLGFRVHSPAFLGFIATDVINSFIRKSDPSPLGLGCSAGCDFGSSSGFLKIRGTVVGVIYLGIWGVYAVFPQFMESAQLWRIRRPNFEFTAMN